MDTALSSLPAPVKTRLDELAATLRVVFDGDLDSILVYGSVARGAYRNEESDVDLMVVLNDDTEKKLELIGPALRLARFSARIEVMFLRKDEVARAADCFPLLYDDIARASIVLHGQSPFAGMPIESEHRRLRIEQELREARIRMRRVASDMGAEPGFGRAIERKVKQLRAPLWALMSLRGQSCPEDLDAVLGAAGRAYDVDTAPLLRARDGARPAYDTLATLLDRALDDVDRRGRSEAK